jgi:hypothetical protein
MRGDHGGADEGDDPTAHLARKSDPLAATQAEPFASSRAVATTAPVYAGNPEPAASSRAAAAKAPRAPNASAPQGA